MANIFGKWSFLLLGLLRFYNTQQQWFPSVLSGWYGHGKRKRSTWSQRERNPGSSFIHIIVMLLMTINRGTKGRNVLKYTILGGASGALHQLLKLYLKRKFLLVINTSNCVPGFKWYSAYHSQQESSKCWTSRGNSKNHWTTYIKKNKLSKKRQFIIGYRRLLLTFALEAKGAAPLDSQFPTTLFLPRLQHLLYPIHTPGFPDPEAPDKQEAASLLCGIRSDIPNRHTKALDPRTPLPSAHFRFKGNKSATSILCSPGFSCHQDRLMF